MPLSGLSICAVADRVVVKQGANRWHAESGQYLLAFEGDPEKGALSVIERDRKARSASALDWLERAAALETDDVRAAIGAYERALDADPQLLDASINLGWLLHEQGDLAKAEKVYRQGLAAKPDDPTLLYNLGVLLEDQGRKEEALAAYQSSLRGNATLADCHYNLALLYENLGRPKDAIRHMAQYRRLIGTRSK
jgi:tetratricopeptide (TPR) repeat protein